MDTTIIRNLVCLLLAIIICSTATINAETAAGCVTDKCHNSIDTAAYVHGPVGARICTICHNPVSGKDHKFDPIPDESQLCLGCHEEKRDMTRESHVHSPVADGQCTGCHSPHQSSYRFNLKEEGSALCFTCHEQDEFSKEFVHAPVEGEDCIICHNPHASANEKQLVTPRDELCFSCHEEKSEILTKDHIHPPVEDDCTNCHSPHSGDAEFQLESDVPNLCFECHDDIADNVQSSHQHPPAAEGQCLDCHDVHASDHPNMFQMPQAELCFSCHDEMAEYVGENEFRHGPVKEGDCNACHNPHGSENWRILRKDFPQAFYAPYATENYAICFQCHNQDIALDERTTTLTDFRRGDLNLHFLHVNKEEKGRSCRACHQVHASSQERHIRESVTFGSSNWELPITYTKLEDGGRCVVGCHAPKEYRRD